MELLLAVARSLQQRRQPPTASRRPQQSLITRHDAGRDPDVAGRYQRRRSRAGTAWSTAGTRQPRAGVSRAAVLDQVTVRPPRRHQSHRAASPATSPSPGHLPRHPRQDEAPLLRGPLRSVTSTRTKSGPDRDRDRLSRIARAAVLDAIAGQLPGYQQDGDIPARVHRAGHPVREPAGDPRPRRPPRIRHALPNRYPGHQRTRPSPPA
jgi:hypothetical protein